MGKVVIDAKQATLDIRAGLSDATLMAKYRLNAKGLQSLRSKLVGAGLLKPSEIEDPKPFGIIKPGQAVPKITVEKILSDIKLGMRDKELMQKYKITAKGVQKIYDQFLSAGLITEAELDDNTPDLESTVEIGLEDYVNELTESNWDEDQEIPPPPTTEVMEPYDTPPPLATHLMETFDRPPQPAKPVTARVKKKPDDPFIEEAIKSTLAPIPPSTTIEPIEEDEDLEPEEESQEVKSKWAMWKMLTTGESRLILIIRSLRWFGLFLLFLGTAVTIISLFSPIFSRTESGFIRLNIAILPMLASAGLFLLFWAAAEGLELRQSLSRALSHNNQLLIRLLEGSDSNTFYEKGDVPSPKLSDQTEGEEDATKLVSEILEQKSRRPIG